MARYGLSNYGVGLYGVETPVEAICEPDYSRIVYTRFAFSGVNLGYYPFEINPTSYNAYPQRTTKAYDIINGVNPTIDEDYNKLIIDMSWGWMPERMWNKLVPYARKKVDGTSENTYFWDLDIARFNGVKIRVENLKAEARAGSDPVDRFNVSLQLRVSTI